MTETVENLVVTKRLTVKHPDAPFGIDVIAQPTGAGLWIGDKACVAVHNVGGQCCVWVGHADASGPHAFAISVDDKGEPGLQLARPGKTPVVLCGDKLQRLFELADKAEG